MYGDLIIGFGRIVASELKGALKSILLNISFFSGDDEAHGEPMFGLPGFFCRPRPPVENADATGLNPQGAAEVVALRVGDETIPISYRDLRLNSVVNPKEGELGLSHYGGGFISLAFNTDEDGTNIMLYAPRKDSSGTTLKASCISMDSTDGNQHVSIMHESGCSITLTKDSKIVLSNKTGDAYIEINDDGIFLNGNCFLNGAVVLGTNSLAGVQFAMIGPLPGALSTMVKLI